MGATRVSNIYSMTGFGECLVVEPEVGASIRVQIKSVNSRFLDLNVKLPIVYSSAETEIQKRIKTKIKRGRVEVSVSRVLQSSEGNSKLNGGALDGFVQQLSSIKISDLSSKEVLLSAIPALLSRKEVFESNELESISEAEKIVLLDCFDKSLEIFISSRREEGAVLGNELTHQITGISNISELIKSMSQASPLKLKDKFQARLTELLGTASLNQERLEQEVAILADRTDIREEIVRLDSHIKLFTDSMPEGGRKLEFIVQELGREINTIGSKSSEVELSTLVIEAKSILEKIREQIQNVE